MASRNVRTALTQVEAFNSRDLDALVSCYAGEFTMTDHARGVTLTSREEVKGWMSEWLAGSSDARISVAEVIDGGDAVVSVLDMEGTNDGPMGSMPSTGRPFAL